MIWFYKSKRKQESKKKERKHVLNKESDPRKRSRENKGFRLKNMNFTFNYLFLSFVDSTKLNLSKILG